MKLLLLLAALFVTYLLYGQEFRKDLAVKDTVYTIGYQKSNGVTRICLYRHSDTLCFVRNSLDHPIFLNTVKQLLRTKGVIDTPNVQEYAYAISAIYEHFIVKEAESNFWDDHMEYLGLKEAEVIRVKKDLTTLQEYNRSYRIYKKNSNKGDSAKNNSGKINYNTEVTKHLEGVPPAKIKRQSDTAAHKSSEKSQPKRTPELDALIVKREILRRDIRTHFSKRKYSVSLIGNANVVSSFKTVDKTQLNAGFGLQASRKGSNGFGPFASEFLGIITVAQSSDTVKSSFTNDFGQAVLVPGVRRFSLLTSFRQTSIFPLSGRSFLRKFGFEMNVNATPYQWIIPSKVNENVDSLSAKVLPVAVDVMFPFTWMYHADKHSDIYIATDIGFSIRYLGGNINAEGRSGFLGNSQQVYAGLMAGLTFRYNGLRAQFHCPLLFGKQVEGLTNGQAFASIGLITDIVNDVKNILKPKREETTSVN